MKYKEGTRPGQRPGGPHLRGPTPREGSLLATHIEPADHAPLALGDISESGHRELADAIAASGGLFNHDGVLVRLDGDGELVPVNLADLAS